MDSDMLLLLYTIRGTAPTQVLVSVTYTMAIRVVLADDHHLVRRGLRQLLTRECDIEVVDESSDGQAAIDSVARFRPDDVVMDVRMPVIDGIEATGRIRTSFSDTQVVMLSMHSDPVLIRKALANGARGYVLKESIGEELVHAIRTAYRGATHRSRVVERAEAIYSQSHAESNFLLTSSERQILQLIASGLSNRQISERLRVSVKTVENHRNNLMAKLNTHSLSDLIRTAIKLGLIDQKE